MAFGVPAPAPAQNRAVAAYVPGSDPLTGTMVLDAPGREIVSGLVYPVDALRTAEFIAWCRTAVPRLVGGCSGCAP
ncbi:MAG TPA: hypothetical protein VII06_23750 [Chloroflexota bacterium]